ncbi:MAG: UDP-N-acetylmuramate dehydrogenase [Thermoguttaceae bacterium]|nr:UDP-N-acetylmuramate dehydrogenase [Thermoguttaceae bacterium]MDW8037877.1 UDP-N-acetylmuramate dehydrogenase [Thermoguttaceae bacterium]
MSWLEGFEKIVRQDEPLAMHTWFQLGGPAEFFAEPRSMEELAALVQRCREQEIPLRILGRGSNILIRDEGVRGVVVQLTANVFRQIHVQAEQIIAGGAARLGRVVTTAVHEGLAGLEPFVAIPGSVAGAVRTNAGGVGTDIGQWIISAKVMTETGQIVERSREELGLGYRQCRLDDPIILEVCFQLEPDDPRQLAQRLQKLWILKKAKQPMGHQAAGYIFKDPPGLSAGELIEQAGLKGTRIGGAVVCDRNANFIIAEPECTAQDILRLIDLLRQQVRDRLGVELELGLEIW